VASDPLRPQWAADPSARHEWRYWDGLQWTHYVADRGVQSIDPLGATPPTAATASGPSDRWPPPLPSQTIAEPTTAWPAPDPATRVVSQADLRQFGQPEWWRRLDGLKTSLVVLFICTALAALATVGALANRVQVIDDLRKASFLTAELARRAHNADDAVGGAAAALVISVLATGVVFIIWMWRASKNAQVLSRTSPRFGPGWSIGGWFIPFANLVIPVLIVQDLWRASGPTTSPGSGWRRESGSGLVGSWWGFLVAGSLVSRATSASGNSLDDLRSQNQAALSGYVFLTVAAVLAAVMVVKLTQRFNDRALQEQSGR